MKETEVYYVDVLLPLHLPGTYTYRVPQEYNGTVAVGMRVVVQFGQKSAKMYSAIVRRIHQVQPPYKCKYILALLDVAPIVTPRQLEHWEWLARYYMCTPGDVMAGESALTIHPDFSGELSELSKHELQIVQLLSDHPVMRVVDISRAIGVQKIMPIIRGMIERQVVMMDEELRERFTPRKTAYLRLADEYMDENAQKEIFETLEQKRRFKQVELLMQYLQRSHFGHELLPKRDLPQGTPLQSLIKSGILVVEERLESKLETFDASQLLSPDSIQLNAEQQAAYDLLASTDRPVSLLHGVTSSGKTEVYIKLIHKVIQEGQQALFLLPEIALTAQLINRLRRYFGIRASAPANASRCGSAPWPPARGATKCSSAPAAPHSSLFPTWVWSS